MARLRRDCIVQLIALLALAWAAPALTQDAAEAGPAGLYDRPTLVLDPGMHTALIMRADVDAAGRYAVTGSDDKTVRVWSVEDGRLLRTIRLPAGPGGVGKVYAVAISPDGELIAAGGWTRWAETDPEKIYLFDRATGDHGRAHRRLADVVNHLTFSPDGRYLAATLGGAMVFASTIATPAGPRSPATPTMPTSSYGADFSADGRLATTSYGRPRPAVRPQLPAGRESANGRRTAALRHRLQPRRDEAGRRLRRAPRRSTSSTAARSRHCRARTPTGSTTAISQRWPGRRTAGPCSRAADIRPWRLGSVRSWPGPTPGRVPAASCRPAPTRS